MARILVIEDDLDVRNLYTKVLESGSHQVEVAGNGQEGLNKILEGGYNLILLDIMLPDKDGLTLLQELKSATPKQENGPIVVLTNLAKDPILKDALALGATEAISKTEINTDTLLAKVNSLLAK